MGMESERFLIGCGEENTEFISYDVLLDKKEFESGDEAVDDIFSENVMFVIDFCWSTLIISIVDSDSFMYFAVELSGMVLIKFKNAAYEYTEESSEAKTASNKCESCAGTVYAFLAPCKEFLVKSVNDISIYEELVDEIDCGSDKKGTVDDDVSENGSIISLLSSNNDEDNVAEGAIVDKNEEFKGSNVVAESDVGFSISVVVVARSVSGKTVFDGSNSGAIVDECVGDGSAIGCIISGFVDGIVAVGGRLVDSNEGAVVVAVSVLAVIVVGFTVVHKYDSDDCIAGCIANGIADGGSSTLSCGYVVVPDAGIIAVDRCVKNIDANDGNIAGFKVDVIVEVKGAFGVTVEVKDAFGVTVEMRDAFGVTVEVKAAFGVTVEVKSALDVTIEVRGALDLTIEVRDAFGITVEVKGALDVTLDVTIEVGDAFGVTVEVKGAFGVTVEVKGAFGVTVDEIVEERKFGFVDDAAELVSDDSEEKVSCDVLFAGESGCKVALSSYAEVWVEVNIIVRSLEV
ncbi:unnamed protein product [Thelazia callipaeda]|uniref:Transmembrane protein n=1 Tax=Thelazia callipaeda TaxID=103827 RepID=A0A0N5CV59_THECL|nr:unnamed protein product [Thelazia callipaeda]